MLGARFVPRAAFLLAAALAITACSWPGTKPSPPADVEKPIINVFTATPAVLPIGGGIVTLRWDVSKSSSRLILPEPQSVGASGTVDVFVGKSTTFTLTAWNGGEKETAVANVTVK